MEIKRNILLNPGPATTTNTVKIAQIVPDICPREQEFSGMMKEIRRDLVEIVHGDLQKFTAVLFCGSGTICIDVCLNSLLPEGKKILVVNNGSYSTRAVEVCQYYGLSYIEYKQESDCLPDMEDIEKILKDNSDIFMVYTTHHETGTGILNPIGDIGKIAHDYKTLFVVDTTSSYGMIPIDIEEENIDFCMASAQKGLMAMTGISYIIGNIEAIKASKNYLKRSYYCNLYMQYDYFEKTGEMHFTPPVQTVYALKQGIKEYFDEGEVNKYQRHLRVFEAIHKGLSLLGFKDLIRPEWQSGLVVSVCYPDDLNWSFEKIHDYCFQHGFTIYPGKVSDTPTFRLCSLGAIDVKDIEMFFEIFKAALVENGVQIPVK